VQGSQLERECQEMEKGGLKHLLGGLGEGDLGAPAKPTVGTKNP